MIDPKEHVVSVGPRKGAACYLCGAALDALPSLQIQVQMPLLKFKKVIQQGCVSCARELVGLLQLRIAQAERGEYQT